MKASTMQRMLARNRSVITQLHIMLNQCKAIKTEGDFMDNQEQEYDAHEAVKVFKKHIANYVLEQKELKQLLKSAL